MATLGFKRENRLFCADNAQNTLAPCECGGHEVCCCQGAFVLAVVRGEFILIHEDIKMKNLLWIVLAAIVLIGGYVLVTGNSPAELIETDSGEQIDAPAELEQTADDTGAAMDETAADAGAAADQTGDAIEASADDVLENADGTMSAVEGTASDAAASATDAANTAVEGVQDAVDAMSEEGSDAMKVVDDAAADAVEATGGAAEGAADAVKTEAEAADDAANAATATDDTATESTEEGTMTDSATEAAAPLTVENFDMDAAAQMIENSNINATQKTLLKATLQKAQENPELLKAALAQARAALGM